ncbi:acyl-CoA dehydrogenase family protein [Umezawaea sp. NPDC059074]|uniref:acyl-CoA dehydrogenase family protein n=1 Tax=Umezawaea sp. NPDC059074 TaxID=3346716 RepID=UPI0036D04996
MKGGSEEPKRVRNATSDPDRVSFLEELYQGRFRWDVIRDFPVQSPEDRRAGDVFVSEVTALVRDRVDPDEVDAKSLVPADVLTELADRGYFRLQADDGVGGHGLSHFNVFRIVRAAAGWCVPVAMSIALENTLGAGAFATMLPHGPLRDLIRDHVAHGRFSASADTEPEGAGNLGRATTATVVEDGRAYLLHGTKVFVGHAPIAGLVGVSATVRENGSARVREFFVRVDAPGVVVGGRHEYLGIKGFANGWLRFDGVRVPAEHVLVEPDAEHQVRMTQTTGRLVTRGRIHHMGAPSLAAAKLCVGWIRDFAKRRTIDGRPLADYQEVRHQLAESLADTFVIETVSQWSLLPEDQDRPLNVRFEQNAAKNVTSLLCWRVLDRTMSLLGGEGYETATSKAGRGAPAEPVERLLRDLRHVRVAGGVDFQVDNWIARMSILSYYYPEPAHAAELTSGGVPLDPDPRLDDRNADHRRWVAVEVREFGARCLALARAHPDKDSLLVRERLLIDLARLARELMTASLVLARAATMAEAGDHSGLALADIHCVGVRHGVADLRRRLDQEVPAAVAAVSAAWLADSGPDHLIADTVPGTPPTARPDEGKP